ncbi:unnamed protein product [Caenorhabditis sp. 36 PRJEB53466]|nr:unnamed protein product [Caenorhabditis sp. 36 PRJEB53466]
MLSRIVRFRWPTPRRFIATFHVEEEYYEELEPSGAPQKTSPEPRTPSEVATSSGDANFLENVIGALTAQRAKDVFVVETDEFQMTPFTHKIICSAYNSRQASAISENLRGLLKVDDETIGGLSHAKKNTKRSNGWYVSEVERVQVHVMSEECREKYELEAVWAGDERILEQIDAEKQRIFLPPKRTTF